MFKVYKENKEGNSRGRREPWWDDGWVGRPTPLPVVGVPGVSATGPGETPRYPLGSRRPSHLSNPVWDRPFPPGSGSRVRPVGKVPGVCEWGVVRPTRVDDERRGPR